MTSMALADRNDPEPAPTEPDIDAHATAALSGWLHDHPEIATELTEAAQARIYFAEIDDRATAASAAAATTERRVASLSVKVDPAGQQSIGLSTGVALVAGLVALDIVPLNWAAQAFSLDSRDSVVVTAILVAGSVAAMIGLEATKRKRRIRVLLAGAMAVAGLVLVYLRFAYLIGEPSAPAPVSALLQAVLLSVISAFLVVGGCAILARTQSPRVARARALARRARRHADGHHFAQVTAGEKLQRHLGALRQMLIPWALATPAPGGVDQVTWTAALERAVRALFAGL
jgi:hypothetical protein